MDKNEMNDHIEILSQPEKVAMADEWYQYATTNNFWMFGRFQAINNRYNFKPNLKLLEVGCGNGAVIDQFKNAGIPNIEGCDLNIKALSFASPEPRKTLYSLNIFDKPKKLKNQYDGVLLLDVIEHIEDDIEFLRATNFYLKENGLIIINVPALNFLFSKYDVQQGHKRRYTIKKLRNVLKEVGLEEISISYWGFTFAVILFFRKIYLSFIPDEKVVQKGFSPPSKFINSLLRNFISLENKLFRKVPIGSSVIGIAKINKK